MKKKLSKTGFLCAVAILGVAMIAGCPAKREVTLPETFPVSGKIVTNAPLPDGYQIQLTSGESEKNAFGAIQKDGTFTLTTRYMGVACEGVAEGSYTVTLIPPLALCNQGVIPYTPPQPIKISGEVTDLKIVYPGR